MKHAIKFCGHACLISILVSSASIAGTAPQHITFQEGEQFNVSLSRLNYNRVFVEGEKIISASFPAGTVIMDKSDMENPNSPEESAYFKPIFDEPITIFFTTDKKHHFSLTVKANETTGKTVALLARRDASRYVKSTVNNVSDIEDVMAKMREGEVPKDFVEARVIPRPFVVKKDVKVVLQKQYEGEKLTGYVYRLENKGARSIELSTSLFDKRNAASLALSDDTLEPKQIAYLYGLYSHEG